MLGLATRSCTRATAPVLRQGAAARRGFAVSVGHHIAVDDVSLSPANTWDDGLASEFKKTTLKELFAGKKVALFAVPGAYTGVCHQSHVPSFVEVSDALRAKGVDEIACVSVNDPYVMQAWGASFGGGLSFYGDADGSFTSFVGQAVDLNVAALGPASRSNRYSMLVDDGKVVAFNVEEGAGDFKVSGGTAILEAL